MITFNFIKYLILYIKYYKILNKVYNNEYIIDNLSQTFKTEFKKDWVGRLYCIFNPNLIDGKFDPNHQIYSYNDKGLNTDDFVEQYIMTQLNIIDHYIKVNNLFELLSYDLKQLDNYNNYLFIIKPIPFDDLKKWMKLFIFISIPILITITILLNIYIFKL
jgi:hypothetical protein